MTVAEFKEILKELNDEMEVFVDDEDGYIYEASDCDVKYNPITREKFLCISMY